MGIQEQKSTLFTSFEYCEKEAHSLFATQY